MSVVSLMIAVSPEVILFLQEHPYPFQARLSNRTATLLSQQLEKTSRLGGDSQTSNLGRMLTAISATEKLLKREFEERGEDYLKASLNIGNGGEFVLEISLEEGRTPTFFSTLVQ